MIKIKIFEDNKEKIVGIDKILSRELRKKHSPVTITAELRQNKTIELEEFPIDLSELVYINGIYMTEGADYDYTINQKTITFNINVLNCSGHILIVYKYLNVGV